MVRLGKTKTRPPRAGGKKKRVVKSAKLLVFLVFCALTAAAAYTASALDTRVLPPVLAAVEKTARNRVNASINQSFQNLAKENTLAADDFIVKTTDAQGMVNSVSVNTMLVNDICGRLAVDVSKDLEAMGRETVRLPLGGVFSIRALANSGPSLPVTVLPMGGAAVDYESAFESVGINQVNFRLWLRVDAAVRVVNPVQTQDILVSRKIALVNTVFSGKVPDAYLGLPNANPGADSGS